MVGTSIALEVIVLCVFAHHGPKVPLTQWNHLTETLRFDRANKALCISIQIRAACRHVAADLKLTRIGMFCSKSRDQFNNPISPTPSVIYR